MIKTIADVRNFFDYLTQERKVSFHPDDDFENYINWETKEPTFTPEECKEYNEAMQQCFDVCQAEGEDIYLIGIDALFAANGVSNQPPSTGKNRNIMKQNIKKQIKDLMGILNPASSYRYQYEERAGKYTLYYLNANKQQIVLADSVTPEQMVAVLEVLVTKNDHDIPTLWPCMYENYAKQLKSASAGIRSMLYNLVHDVGTVWFKKNPVIYVKTKDETFEPVHIQSLRWEDKTVAPMAVNIMRSEEYSLDDGVAAETCARLLEEIVKQKLFEIK